MWRNEKKDLEGRMNRGMEDRRVGGNGDGTREKNLEQGMNNESRRVEEREEGCGRE